MSVNQRRTKSTPSSRIRSTILARSAGSLVALSLDSTCAMKSPPENEKTPDAGGARGSVASDGDDLTAPYPPARAGERALRGRGLSRHLRGGAAGVSGGGPRRGRRRRVARRRRTDGRAEPDPRPLVRR